MSKPKITFILCICVFFPAGIAIKLCEMANRWTHNGRDLIRDYRANILLVAFLPLQDCHHDCDNILERYTEIQRNHDYKILVIAPQSAAPHEIRLFAARHTALRFEHETGDTPIWRWFNASAYDHFVFDRCSRLAEVIPFAHPKNGLGEPITSRSQYFERHIQNTAGQLKYVVNYANCGWCEYDTTPLTPAIQPKLAYFSASTSQEQQPPEQQQLGQPQQSARSYNNVRTPQPIVRPSHFVVNVTENATNLQPKNVPHVPSNIDVSYRQRQQLQQYASTTTTLPYHNYQNGRVDERLRHSGTPGNSYDGNYADRTPTARTNVGYEQQQREQQRQYQQQYQQRQQHRDNQRSSFANQQQQQQQEEYQRREQYLRQQERSGYKRVSQSLQQTTEPEGRGEKPKPQPIQYAKDVYTDRYQYRLHSDSFNEVQRQREAERRRESEARRQEERRRQQQIEELQRARIQQQEQLREQQRLEQQQKAEQQRRADEERRRSQSQNPAADGGSSDPAPLYPEGSENFDYYESDSEWTTPPAVLLTSQTTSSTPMLRIPQMESRDYGFNLPCDTYNDDICYQQHTQFKPHEIHRCCKNRVLFTDQCRPGKCSNVTQQLCCIQKFLQAKLTCCTDEKQLEANTASDSFSRCCYSNFITDDDACCTRSYASAQWRTVHELCHPNVHVDLSRVRVPTVLSGTSLTTEFDFGKTDKWNFTCKYGTHVPQFSYNGDSSNEAH